MNTSTYRSAKALIIFLCAWSIILFFPGTYSVDSFTILDQVIANEYTDWHTPVYSWVWHVLYSLTGQYFILYLLQMAAYWWLVLQLLKEVKTNTTGLIVCLLLSWFYIFIPQYIMKDVHIILCWLAVAIIGIYNYKSNRQSKQHIKATFLIILVGYAAALRYNNIFTAAILFYFVLECFNIAKGRIFNKLVISATLCILTVVATFFFTYTILDAKKEYPEYKWMLLDISGITINSGENYFPKEIQDYENFDVERLKKEYTPATIDNLYWPDNGSLPLFPEPNENINQKAAAKWRVAILEHPLTYLKNRLAGFNHYLRIKQRFANTDYWSVTVYIQPNNKLNISRSNWWLLGPVLAPHYLIKESFILSPWVWLTLNVLFAVIFFVKYKKSREYLYKLYYLLQLSGIIFMLSQLPFFQHDRDLRYSYWNLILFFIGIIQYISSKQKKASEKTS